MEYEDQLPSRVVSALQKLAEQEKEAVTRCAQQARRRLLDQKVGPGEARDQLQLFAMGEASAHGRADDYAPLAQKGHCPAAGCGKAPSPSLAWPWKAARYMPHALRASANGSCKWPQVRQTCG